MVKILLPLFLLSLLLPIRDAYAAISVTGFNNANSGNGVSNSLVVNAIAGAAQGDLLLAQVTLDDANTTVTAPAGWTELAALAQSNSGIQQRVYWRIRVDTATEPTSYTWTLSPSARATVIVGDFAGVDTTQTISGTRSSGTSATLIAPSVTASSNDGMLVAFFGTTGTGSTVTPQSSMASPASAKASGTSGGSGNGVQAALGYETITNSGVTGTRTATGSAGNYVTQSIFLSSAACANGFNITFPALSQTACDDSGDILIKACKSGYTNTSKSIRFSYSYTDPSTGTQGLSASTNAWVNSTAISLASAGTTTVLTLAFDSSGTAKVRVKYADVGKLTLNVSDTSVSPAVTGSALFVVRPAGFFITGVTNMAGTANPAAADATGAKFVAAGASFKVTAEARNNCSPAAVTPNFGKESTLENIALSSTLVAGLGLSNNPALVTETDFTLTNGAGTAVVNWPEVGIIQLTPRLKSGAYMNTNDVVGSTGNNVGRFYADHFDVALTQGCSIASFTYDKQPFPTMTLTAKAKNGSTLQNYRGSSTASLSFAKPVTLLDTTGKGTIAPTIPALAFTAGSALLDDADSNHPRATFSFNISPTAPATIAVAAIDFDNGGGSGLSASANIRSGRMRLQNAYGSERLALPVPLEAQYWQGSGVGGYWTLNTLDSCTVLPMTSFAMASTFTLPCQSQITPTGSVTLTNGKIAGTGLVLTKPNQAGQVLLTLNTSTATGSTCTTSIPAAATSAGIPWLPMYPAGSVLGTFGIYKSPLLDRREIY